MFILCCNQDHHPKDWFCKFLKKYFGYRRPRCGTRGGVFTGHNLHSGPDGMLYTADDVLYTPGGSVVGVSVFAKAPSPWILERVEEFNKMLDDPTPDQLTTFVDGLRTEGFYHDTLKMSSHLMRHTPPLDTRVHSRLALIQGQTFEVLNEPEAAKKSFEIATHWMLKSSGPQTFSREYAPTAKTVKKLAKQKPEELILAAQKHYAKGAYKKALRVTQHIEGNVPLRDRYVHIQNNVIRTQALEKLNDTQAAAASMEMVTDLTQMDMALRRATQIR